MRVFNWEQRPARDRRTIATGQHGRARKVGGFAAVVCDGPPAFEKYKNVAAAGYGLPAIGNGKPAGALPVE